MPVGMVDLEVGMVEPLGVAEVPAILMVVAAEAVPLMYDHTEPD